MSNRKQPFFRRVERWLVGLAMAVLAFALEKVLLRSIGRGDAKSPPR